MWGRQSWFSLNGTIGIQEQERGTLLRHSAPQHQPTDPCTTLALAVEHLRECNCPILSGWYGGSGRGARHRAHGLAHVELSHDRLKMGQFIDACWRHDRHASRSLHLVSARKPLPWMAFPFCCMQCAY